MDETSHCDMGSKESDTVEGELNPIEHLNKMVNRLDLTEKLQIDILSPIM